MKGYLLRLFTPSSTALIQSQLDYIMSSLDTLQAQVAATDTAIASAVTLINGLGAQLAAAIAANKAGDNGAALDTLSADLSSSTDALAAAVAANTTPAP